MLPGSLGRGRGRGRGNQRKEEQVETRTLSRSPSEQSEKSFVSCSAVTSTSTFGRGRGRGSQSNLSPSPVTLPDNPEEDDFLAAFRRLQSESGQGSSRASSSKGKDFPFSSCPCPSEGVDSGFISKVPTTQFRTPGTSFGASHSQAKKTEMTVDDDVGSEDYTELERVVIKRGEKGRQVPVIANYLQLTIANKMGIYEYHVEFDPPLESFRFKKKVISSLQEKLGKARNFDGAKLYLAILLPKKVSVFHVPYPMNPAESGTVSIQYVKKNCLTDCVHFYNVLFRRVMECLGLIEMKRHFYNYRAVFDLPQHKLEIWPGYVTAVDEYEGGLMLCCDTSFRVLRTSTVLDVWNNFLLETDRRQLENAKRAFVDYVLGKIILTRYNNRNYRVDDIDWNQTPMSKFTNSKGVETTFLEYYKTAYNITIRDRTQPLIIHRPKPNPEGVMPLICLVPELCFITGMDSSITSNYHIMRDLAHHTKLNPAQRYLALQQFVRNVNECEEARSILQLWGLTLEKDAVQLEARKLTIPKVMLNEKMEFHPDTTNFGNKVMQNAVYDPVPVRNWLLLFSRHDREKAGRLVDLYRQVSHTFGIAVSFNETQQAVNVGNGTTRDYREALEKHLRQNTQFVVAIIPSSRDDLYTMIKRICSVNRPVPSQVILSKTLTNDRKLRSVVQKIALQINCKLGGSLWAIRIPLPEKIMFIGMDVFHDPKQKSNSVTGIVGSLNPNFTKYYSRVVFQHKHQETVSSMQPVLTDLMTSYYKENNAFPDRVIVWRDGVSDGQLSYTKSHEVAQLYQLFQTFNIEPKFTFCVVQKRINARFFLAGKYEPTNPEPGTIVDHKVTRKYLYDFFLVSQLVREGTVTPSHFVVLEDNADIPPDLIQKFAFATSFMYFNWTGSIRVPAMCQYAHKLASLVGQSIKAEPSLELSKNLYYL